MFKFATRQKEEQSYFKSQKAFWEPLYEGLDYMLERELEHMESFVETSEKEVEEI